EMCYSLEVAQIVKELGFQWIVVDETAYNGKIGSAKDDVIYSVEGAGDLVIFFKERPFSAGITYGEFPAGPPFLKALKDRLNRNCYLLTGTDGEVYGHHRPGQEKLLLDIWAKGQPPTCTISELIKLFPKREKVRPLPSSWSTWEDEMAQGIPYPQWDYPGHELHRLQWQLTHLTLETIKSLRQDTKGYAEARRLLDEGLHSCQYWWASCRPWWDTGMVEWGARKLFDSVAKVQDALPEQKFQQAQDLLNSIISTARRWQDSGEAKRRKEQYLKEHGEVSTELTFGGGN
ncbi:MAG TPA: hypothetical protein VMW64_00465, partial [Dehalococcoidia bacterium]|nr:hypothetical protein [Dehalococcoidia bacterium]